MSLFKKMFGDRAVSQAPVSSSFPDSGNDSGAHSRGAPRREVIYVVLRETMRMHGIPNDWIECRSIDVARDNRRLGIHLTLVVKDGQDQLLPYVPAFQASFREALGRFDPRALSTVQGLSWQFEDRADAGRKFGSQPGEFQAAVKATAPAPTAKEDEELQRDLQALFAIRDAALNNKKDPPDFQPTQPAGY